MAKDNTITPNVMENRTVVSCNDPYDFHKLLNTANTLNHLSEVEHLDNGLKFKKQHQKMENIWAAMHPLGDNESPCNLGDWRYQNQLRYTDIVTTL